MAELDWQQWAQLIKVNLIALGEGHRQTSGKLLGQGSLDEVLKVFSALADGEKAKSRLEIAGGFHLDGAEIADLVRIRHGG